MRLASALRVKFSEHRGSNTKKSHDESHVQILLKGLILAQNERWRRGLGMQVERIPVL